MYYFRFTSFAVLIFLFFFVTQSFGQKEITIKETLNYLNKKFVGTCEFSMVRQMKVTFYKNGEPNREDVFYLENFDTTKTEIDTIERSITLNCSEYQNDCVQRTIYLQGIKRNYTRFQLIMPAEMDEKSFLGVRCAIIYLLRMVNNNNYSSTIPFE